MEARFNLIADSIYRTVQLGLTITDAADAGALTVVHARSVTVENACPGYQLPGRLRDYVTQKLLDLPDVGFITEPQVQVHRFSYDNGSCTRKIFQASLSCAKHRAKLTHRYTRWVLQRLAIDRMSVKATATTLGIGWQLVNQTATDVCHELV